jgi:hypothetical protein
MDVPYIDGIPILPEDQIYVQCGILLSTGEIDYEDAERMLSRPRPVRKRMDW